MRSESFSRERRNRKWRSKRRIFCHEKTGKTRILRFFPETHDGVQDMACDTFIKIAQKCRRHFVQMQAGEVMPFIEEILSNISTIICDLQPQQVGGGGVEFVRELARCRRRYFLPCFRMRSGALLFVPTAMLRW